MTNFSLGLSALRSSQFALEVVSNNIANADTEGFHRRSVHFQSLAPNVKGNFRIGAGVSINFIERVRDQVTEASLTNVIADVHHVDQLIVLERQIEATLFNGDSSIGAELDDFFAEMTKLTAAPDEPSQRASVVESGRRFAGVLRQAANQLDDLRDAVKFQIGQEIDALNKNMNLLSELNAKIKTLTAQGMEPNTELDQRDALLNRIAQTVGISRNDHFSGELNLMFGNASVQQSGANNQFVIQESHDGQLHIHLDDSERPIDLVSGRLIALMDVYNTTLPKYQSKLDELASGLMSELDSVHATGVGTDGSFQHLTGSRVVQSASIPLSEAGTAFPVQAGDLSISIVDSLGNRRTETITIDPDVDSLNDIAQKLSQIDGLNSAANPGSNQLRIFADENHRFDFSGSLETTPDLSSFSGSSIPTLGGNYTGAVNEDLTFSVEGSGDVGITEGLKLNVFSENGTLKQQINIGKGYESGSVIELDDGVTISLARGTVVDGESFHTEVRSKPDETGFLAALGLNSFFSGTNARTIDVDARIDAGTFAAGSSSDAADTFNLFRLTELEDKQALAGNLTFTQFINEINTEIGFQINTDTALSASLQSLQTRLEQDRDSYSGVDLNEEIVYLQQFQKSYEAAVRVIQTTDDILNELFSILR